MSNGTGPSRADVEAYADDPINMDGVSAETLYSFSRDDLDRIQLAGLRRRFGELAQKLDVIRELADDNRIDGIREINEIVPLLLPHTACKSYPLSLIDNARFEHLNLWLDRYTSFDLSTLDVSGSETLDDWLNLVERETPVRVITSSGTSGKLSIIPRSTIENRMLPAYFRAFFQPFGDEPGYRDVFAPGLYTISPQLPGGRHSTALAAHNIVQHAYGGDSTYYITPQGENSTDLLWMAGRMRKAQADGTMAKLKASKAWKRIDERLAEFNASRSASLDEFYCDTATRLKGKTVILRMGITFLRDMVQACERRGVALEFAPDSMIVAAGGLKGQAALTDEEMASVQKALPYATTEVYAFSECYGGLARKCKEGHYHAPPWLVGFVLDPETGFPYPRRGEQTGRYAAFDLWAQTYWGGYVTGDKVTVNWEGGCGCGRKGPYMHGKIERYSEINGGDDKITCQRTAAAVGEMMQHLLSQ
jgi:hypothetical protein